MFNSSLIPEVSAAMLNKVWQDVLPNKESSSEGLQSGTLNC